MMTNPMQSNSAEWGTRMLVMVVPANLHKVVRKGHSLWDI